ncbi:MAG: serine/threonine-protein kinase [archaeon]|nr:serine/threonine-protein kinase [archaeon]
MDREIEDITLGNKIGKGAYGEVYMASKAGSKEKFAAKKIKLSMVNNPKLKKYFNNEVYLLQHVNHPNIIRLDCIKKTPFNLYLVFEHCNGGDLSGCLKKYKDKYNKPFPEEYAQHIIKQMVEGVYYLHCKKNIIHRDLKSDNILITFQNESDKANLRMDRATVKIIDFGFARKLEKGQMAQSVLGSPLYMDPRIVFKLGGDSESLSYDYKADIWSLGTICYEILVGFAPFNADSYDELVSKIKEGHLNFPDNLKLSLESISFINDMLQFNPMKRKTIDVLAGHSFINKNVNTFQQLLMKSTLKGDTKIDIKDSSVWNGIVARNVKTNEEINPEKLTLQSKGKHNYQLTEITETPHDIFEDTMEDTSATEINCSDSYERPEDKLSEYATHEKVPPGFVVDDSLEEMLNDAFDKMNKNFYCVDSMLCPIKPNPDPKIIQDGFILEEI